MNYLIYLFTIIVTVGLDQYTKQLVSLYINQYARLEIIDNFFYLTNVRNTGAAWSMFSNAQTMLIIVSICAIIYFIYDLIKNKNNKVINKICNLLIIGGALGNLIDRISYKYVIDFLDFYIFGYDFPVFNVADIFLTIGCGLFIITTILEMINAKH